MMPYGNLLLYRLSLIATANTLSETVQHGVSIKATNYKIVDD